MTMMTRKGATVEAAIEAALQTLDVSRDKVEVEVLDQGRKGFFGIGSKEAEVKVTVIEKVKPIRTNEERSKLIKEIEVETIEQEIETSSLIEDVR